MLKPLLRSVSVIFTALVFACTAEAPTENSDTADPGGTAVVEITVGGIALDDPADPPRLEFDRSTLSPGQSVLEVVLIRNVGSAVLTLTRARLSSLSAEEGPPTFALVEAVRRDSDAGSETALAITGGALGEERLPAGEELALTILYTRHEGAEGRFAVLTLESDAANPGYRTLAIPVVAAQGGPIATISPNALDFGDVASSTTKSLTTVVTNTGFDWLTLSEYTLVGAGFSVRQLGNPWAPALREAIEPTALVPAVVLAPGESATFEVIFTAPTLASVEGIFALATNGASAWEEVPLIANGKWPCIEVSPDPITFGAASVGKTSTRTVTLSACGKHPVQVHRIELDAAASASFALDLSALPGGGLPSAEDPLTIAAGASVTFDVRFTPDAVSPVTADGPVLEKSLVRVLSDAYAHERAVALTGFGSDVLCPTALGSVSPGTVVPYGTNLKLSSDASFAAPGRTIVNRKWSVTHSMEASAPVAVTGIVPSGAFPNPTFEPILLGEFTFRLDVWDDQGLQSCSPWTTKVWVVSTESFHVELTWRTPNDQDETDEGSEAGSDLELHFSAIGYESGSKYDGDGDGVDDPWFGTYDTYWFSPSPNWGSLNPAVTDDPMMLRDDTDGGGPELIAAKTLKSGQYGIAVHYFNDNGYGDAWAKVRVHVAGNLILETEDVLLSMGDLWNVATVTYPELSVTPLETDTGDPVIHSNYANPSF